MLKHKISCDGYLNIYLYFSMKKYSTRERFEKFEYIDAFALYKNVFVKPHEIFITLSSSMLNTYHIASMLKGRPIINQW